jgi:hypothetical protein
MFTIDWYYKNSKHSYLVPELNKELADRSKSTAFGSIALYVTLFAACYKLHFQDFYSNLFGGSLVLTCLIRYFLSRGYRTNPHLGKVFWDRLFPGVVLLSGLSWGLLTSRILYLNHFSSPLTQISLLILSGIASSSLISLGPCPKLLIAFLNVTLLLPMGVALYAVFGTVNMAFPVIFVLYYGFLLYQAPIYFQNLIKLKVSEEEVRKLNEELEHRIAKRTQELEETNQKLEIEITERKRAEEINYNQAHFDAATCFPNRFSFQEHLTQALPLARRQNSTISILLINIDRYWETNSTLGYDRCNRFIQQVGLFIKEALREADILALF